MEVIKELEQPVRPIIKSFCDPQLMTELSALSQKIIETPQFQKVLQFSITSTKGEDVFEGTGSLYDYSKKEFTASTDQFTEMNSVFKGSAFETVYKQIQLAAEQFGVKIGRSRWMRLNPKTCLSLHWDPDEFRFHIPLKTNEKCFFVVDDICYRMPEVGSLYLLNTTKLHTAVNASFEARDHLVFDTFKV